MILSHETGLDIILWPSEHESYRGVMQYRDGSVSVILEDGKTFRPKKNDGTIGVLVNEILLQSPELSKRAPLKQTVRIEAYPMTSVRFRYYIDGVYRFEDIFPQSTNGFYSRLASIETQTLIEDTNTVSVNCSLHRCLDFHDRVWLTISDSDTGRIYEAYLIHNYERNAITMVEDSTKVAIQTERIPDGLESEELFDFEDFLSGPSPSWEQMELLTTGVHVPNLKMFDTLEETISQLVPQSFPSDVRRQSIAFLGIVALGKWIGGDPVSVSRKFFKWRLLWSLYDQAYIRHILGLKQLSYVRLMLLAARKQVAIHNRTTRDIERESPWRLFWHTVYEGIEKEPVPIKRMLEIINRLNRKRVLTSRVVPSISQGKRSRKAMTTRWVLNSTGTLPALHCLLNYASLGLGEYIYLGSAYRWPHRHMAYITGLGDPMESPLHFQHMILPHHPADAGERIRRFIPSLMHVDWSIRHSNTDRYDADRGEWRADAKRVLKSLNRTRTIRFLRKKYYDPPRTRVQSITVEEASVIDIFRRSLHLMQIDEAPEVFSTMFQIEKKRLFHIGRKLVKRGILDPRYLVNPRMRTTMFIIQGESKKIASVCDAFLEYTPTTTAFLCDGGSHAVFLSRIPPDQVPEIVKEFPARGLEEGLNIRCFRPTTLRNYSLDLISRLRLDDETWDCDVSDFLGQARSKRVEILNG